MSRVYDAIDTGLRRWVERQKLFFVATAPLSGAGHVNLSPKGRDSLRILGERELVWLDLPGSGVETIAHLRENGRITLMLCAFDGPPKIVRFHGRGEVLLPGESDFEALVTLFPPQPAIRSLVRVAVERVSDSCGFGVPFYAWQGERDNMDEFVRKMPDDKLRHYGARNNRSSIDGLDGLAPEEAGRIRIRRDGSG